MDCSLLLLLLLMLLLLLSFVNSIDYIVNKSMHPEWLAKHFSWLCFHLEHEAEHKLRTANSN